LFPVLEYEEKAKEFVREFKSHSSQLQDEGRLKRYKKGQSEYRSVLIIETEALN